VGLGVLNVIHGGYETVNFICDAPQIRAISFVGGNTAGEHIFDRGTKNGKRVQANLGAKNHVTVLPDADKEAVSTAWTLSTSQCLSIDVRIPCCVHALMNQHTFYRTSFECIRCMRICGLPPEYLTIASPTDPERAGGCCIWSCRTEMHGSLVRGFCWGCCFMDS
jgi:hypothetical protein